MNTEYSLPISCASAIEGRTPTPWMLDHMHDFSVAEFYDQSLTESDLRRLLSARTRPRYKLVARVTTAQFRRMVADGTLRASSWTSNYRRAGNTVPVVHRTACLAVFGNGEDIFLCDLPPRMCGETPNV